jgi:hypothetical protein
MQFPSSRSRPKLGQVRAQYPKAIQQPQTTNPTLDLQMY